MRLILFVSSYFFEVIIREEQRLASRYRTAGSPCSITHKVIDVKVPLPIACRISVGAENKEEKKRHLCSFTKAAIFVLISFCLWGVSDPSSKVYLNLINIYMHRNSCKEKTHHVYWRINATHKCNIVMKNKTNIQG